jgi:hypothetical protein
MISSRGWFPSLAQKRLPRRWRFRTFVVPDWKTCPPPIVLRKSSAERK